MLSIKAVLFFQKKKWKSNGIRGQYYSAIICECCIVQAVEKNKKNSGISRVFFPFSLKFMLHNLVLHFKLKVVP